MIKASIAQATARNAVTDFENLYISIPFTEEEKALFMTAGQTDPAWVVTVNMRLGDCNKSPLVFTISDAELVGNSKRQLLEFGDFWYIYIPMNQMEVEKLNLFQLACGMINPAFRLRIDKKLPENRVPMLELTNAKLLAALQSLFHQCEYMGAPLTHPDMKAAKDAIEMAGGEISLEQMECAACGKMHDRVDGIDCPECKDWFCDNCYDTSKGDGCHCHPKAEKTTRPVLEIIDEQPQKKNSSDAACLKTLLGIHRGTETEESDPEAELRKIWTEKGISQERQDELIADVTAKAKPGAMVGPFVIPNR